MARLPLTAHPPLSPPTHPLCVCREKCAWIANLVMSIVWVAVVIALIVVLSMNGGYYYYG